MFENVKYIIGFGIQYKGERINLDLDYFKVDHNIIGTTNSSKRKDK